MSLILKYLILIPALLFCVLDLHSQDFSAPPPKPAVKEPFWSWDKVYWGGGLGLQFGSITYVNLAPDIGYRITKKYSAGIGIRYMYYADHSYTPAYELDIYGASVFNRFIVTDFFFLHGEYEVLNGPWNPFLNYRFNLTNIWVGGGLRTGGDKAALNLIVLWNLNDEGYIPNPQIRMGISVGM